MDYFLLWQKGSQKKYTKTSICQIFRLAALAIIAFSHDDDEVPIMKLFVFKKEGAQKTRAVVHINEGQHRRIKTVTRN